MKSNFHLQSDQELADEEYDKFQSLIYNLTGISFNDSNRSSLASRIFDRMRVAGINNVLAYYDFASGNDEELKLLMSSITINLTRFFRTSAHFEALENFVLPYIIAHKEHLPEKKRIINLWSAGCSTGEEAYSLAICMSEWLPEDFNFHITATDISLPSLYTAQEGSYSKERTQDVPSKLLSKYFTKNKEKYQIKPFLKEHIVFDYNNLMLRTLHKKFDIIFCRNVMIYFDQKSQQKLIDNLMARMKPYSYLFLGHTESLESIYGKLPKHIQKTQFITVYERDTQS